MAALLSAFLCVLFPFFAFSQGFLMHRIRSLIIRHTGMYLRESSNIIHSVYYNILPRLNTFIDVFEIKIHRVQF